MELILELDSVNADDVNADFTKKEKGLRQDILKIMIQQKLDIKGVVHYFADTVDEFFKQMQKEIDDLDKYNRHRHKTIMGLYTEKPVY